MSSRLRKHKLKTVSISLEEWQFGKPYLSIEDFNYLPAEGYEEYYVQTVNEVLKVLLKESGFLKKEFRYGPDEYRSMAIILTSYFEYQINDIGIWKYFIDTNQTKFGYYLPFYDLADYEYNSINKEDVSFLIWYFIGALSDFYFNPDLVEITNLGEKVAKLFKEKIFSAPSTPVYKEFFTFPKEAGLFEFKEKMQWFVRYCFFPCIELTWSIQEQIEKLQRESQFSIEQIGPILYGMMDEYTFQESLRYSGITVREWFTAICHCNESQKENLLQTHKNVLGRFMIEGKDEQYLYIKFLGTNRLFDVAIESLNPAQLHLFKAKKVILARIIPWGKEWWVSGAVNIIPSISKTEIEQLSIINPQAPFYAFEEKYQEASYKINERMEQHFVEFFGGSVFVCDTLEILNEKMNAFTQYDNDKQRALKGLPPTNVPIHNITENPAFQEMPNQAIALSFASGEGVVMGVSPPEIEYLLSKNTPLTLEEKIELCHLITDSEMPASLVHYYLEKVSSGQLAFSETSKIDAKRDGLFLAHFHDPKKFNIHYPNMRATDSSMDVGI